MGHAQIREKARARGLACPISIQENCIEELSYLHSEEFKILFSDALRGREYSSTKIINSSGSSCIISLNNYTKDICHVYFLISGKSIIYIGSSTNIAARLKQHLLDGKNFDAFI